MNKKYPDESPNGNFYSAIGDNTNLVVANEGSSEFGLAHRSVGNVRSYDFSNLTPNLSSRPGLTKEGYLQYRPGEQTPTRHKEIIKYAQEIYEKISLIRNIIDLMGDFGCQGIRLSHTDKRTEKFYKTWFAKVNGPERSERFLNNLYKTANIVIRRQTAKIDLKQRAKLFRSIGKTDIKIENLDFKKGEIPWKYTMLNPSTVDLVGGQLACFADKKRYMINFPPHFCSKFASQYAKEEAELFKSLPKEISEAIKNGGKFLLPEDKTLVFHYKKDDWQTWAMPMTFAIFDDVVLLEKLKLADIAALDGAISNIRIFKLGSLDPLILPGKAAAAKLKEVLGAHTAAGTIDIVWSPDIELVESKTEVYKFLGQEKYEPVLNSIYGGIGIPPTLTGSFSAEGTTNNFISLITLIERLEYGRSVLLSFWNKEIEIVQNAMGFDSPAIVEFDYMDLGDSQSEKSLLIQLSDRGLISDELIQQKFGHNVLLETERIKREDVERENEERGRKISPYIDSQPEEQIKRIAVQKGYLTPKHVGISPQQLGKQINQMDHTKPKDAPGKGRPINSRDTKKRKTKRFTPRTKASLELWASSAQDTIATLVNPLLLENFKKKNMRSLTTKEAQLAEQIKFGVLFTIEPFSELTNKEIISAFERSQDLPANFYSSVESIYKDARADLDRDLTYDEIRHLQVYLYRDIYEDIQV